MGETKKTLLAGSLAYSALALCATGAAAQNKYNGAGERPNIIYIMLDDMSYDMLPVGYDRYPFNTLPNLERLQKEGATFSNFFCTHSLSSPSRATNLTGCYPHIHGMTQNVNGLEPDWERTKTYGTFLQAAGYNTAFIGKIHMSHAPAQQKKGSIRPGFDYWVSFYEQGVYIDPQIVDNGVEKQHKGYMTDILTDYTLEWIKSKRDKDKPFCLTLWHKAVHQPFTPAERHAALYQGEPIGPPPYNTHLDDLYEKPVWQRAKILKRETDIPDRLPPAGPWQPKKAQYDMLRSLRAVDESLGEIIKLLKEEGIDQNTVIMFSSDNGYFHGEHRMGDKRMAYEVSIRIPMVIRWPGVAKPGSIIDPICSNLDVAPTILDLAQVPLPDQFQGASMKNLLAGRKEPSWRKSFLYEYFQDRALSPLLAPTMVGVRTDRYKYVESAYLYEGKPDIAELYDLRNDPGEMKNLVNDKAYAKILKQMQQELERLKKRYRYNPDRDWRLKELGIELPPQSTRI